MEKKDENGGNQIREKKKKMPVYQRKVKEKMKVDVMHLTKNSKDLLLERVLDEIEYSKEMT